MYAYVFVTGIDKESLTRLRGLVGSDGIRYVTTVTGPRDALIALEAADLQALEATIMGPIRSTGVGTTETYPVVPIPPIPPPPMPKWDEPQDVEAFVAVAVEQGRALDVLTAASEIQGFVGGAVVAGSFDVLLEFAGRTYEEVAAILLNNLHTVEGIESTSSYFATRDQASYAAS